MSKENYLSFLVIDKIKPVVAVPPRNCDRYATLWDAVVAWGWEEQGWQDWPEEDIEDGDVNELLNILAADQLHEFIDWLYAEVKGGAE